MDGHFTGRFSFHAVGTSLRGLALRSVQEFVANGPLLVFCSGIEVGRVQLAGRIAENRLLDVPITRMPRVPLPAELRVATAVDGPDLIAPWLIETPEAVLTLLGPPEVSVDDLRLDHGVLRGTARDRRNGLLDPVLYARINGNAARTIEAETPVALPEGGCAFRFSLGLLPADLTEAGLSVQIHLVGQAAPVAQFGWTRSGPGVLEQRLAELEGRIAQMEAESVASEQQVLEALRQRLDLQQERIDSFIDAAATLLLDRMAGPGAGALGPRDAVRALIETVSPANTDDLGLRAGGQHINISAEASVFGAGWHRPESYPGGHFRWMDRRGQILNPAPDRKVSAITLHILHLYKATTPVIEASLDTSMALVTQEPAQGGGFAVRIALPEAGQVGRVLRLTSRTSGCPARDGESTDRRTLSVAVSSAVFEYSD